MRRLAVALALATGCIEEHPGWVGQSGGGSSSTDEGSSGSAESQGSSESGESSGGDGDGDGESGEPEEHRIFVTSTYFDGMLGGLEGADASCLAVARSASLSGGWRALISTQAESVAERIAISGPVRNMTGEPLAADADDLWDGMLANPVRYNESGADMVGKLAWTGTRADGNAGATCADWTDAAQGEYGRVGHAGTADAQWIDGFDDRCFKNFHLYCINQ